MVHYTLYISFSAALATTYIFPTLHVVLEGSGAAFASEFPKCVDEKQLLASKGVNDQKLVSEASKCQHKKVWENGLFEIS